MKKLVIWSVAALLGYFPCEGICGLYSSAKQPSETAVINLPGDEYLAWKEVLHNVKKEEGVVKRAPLGETLSNWSELISVEYLSNVKWKKRVNESIEPLLQHLCKVTIEGHPGKKVTWKVIEHNKTDAIYEWILHEEDNKIPPQYEISRVFLKKSGIHRVSITRKYQEMEPEVKKKWIDQ